MDRVCFGEFTGGDSVDPDFIMPFSSDDVRSQGTYTHSRRMRQDINALAAWDNRTHQFSLSQTSFREGDLEPSNPSFGKKSGQKPTIWAGEKYRSNLKTLAGRIRDWALEGLRCK
jgi:hypothetical protein